MAPLHTRRSHLEVLRPCHSGRHWAQRGHHGHRTLQDARFPNSDPEDLQLLLHRCFHRGEFHETDSLGPQTVHEGQMEPAGRRHSHIERGGYRSRGARLEHHPDKPNGGEGDARDADSKGAETAQDGERDQGAVGYGDAGAATSGQPGASVLPALFHLRCLGGGTFR